MTVRSHKSKRKSGRISRLHDLSGIVLLLIHASETASNASPTASSFFLARDLSVQRVHEVPRLDTWTKQYGVAHTGLIRSTAPSGLQSSQYKAVPTSVSLIVGSASPYTLLFFTCSGFDAKRSMQETHVSEGARTRLYIPGYFFEHCAHAIRFSVPSVMVQYVACLVQCAVILHVCVLPLHVYMGSTMPPPCLGTHFPQKYERSVDDI